MYFRLLLVSALLAVMIGSVSADEAALPAPQPGITHVLVMSLDGMRPDALVMMGAPNILALAERGAWSFEAQTVLPAVTLPAHTSMLTGLDVADHGILFNDRPLDCAPVEAPTFLLLAQQAGYGAAIVTGKEKFCIFWQSPEIDYTFARGGDRTVSDRVIELLDANVQVIFAHYPNPDYFGHLNGWMSEPYLTNVIWTDSQVGRVLDALDARGLTDETLIILTADHGGHDFGHGADIPEDRNIPWMIAGPGVVPGTELSGVSVADTAPTVLWALGVPPAQTGLGVVRLDAFGYPMFEAEIRQD